MNVPSAARVQADRLQTKEIATGTRENHEPIREDRRIDEKSQRWQTCAIGIENKARPSRTPCEYRTGVYGDKEVKLRITVIAVLHVASLLFIVSSVINGKCNTVSAVLFVCLWIASFALVE